MIIQDAHIRQQALDITESFIVQAPAGSGKTELLTQRYLNLLGHAHKAPEEIVAITFTRKAAAEMRVRILEALHFAKTPSPDASHYKYQTWVLANKALERDKALAWDILENPNRLRILTIDGLSAMLCRQTPFQSQLSSQMTVSEHSTPLYQYAAEQAIAELFTQPDFSPALSTILRYLDNNVIPLQNLFSELLAERDQWLPTLLYCYHHHQSLRATLEKNLARTRQEIMIAAAEAMPVSIRQQLVLCARSAGDYLKSQHSIHPITACSDFHFETMPSLDKFEQWAGVATLLLTQDHEWRKTVDVRVGFPPKDPNKTLIQALLTECNEHDDFKNALMNIRICPPESYTDTQWEVLSALTQLLPLLAAQLQLVFQEKNEVDFTALNLAALKALGEEDNPTDLALYLDYQIQHLLIDEFQDTSITHLQLLEKIVAGWQHEDGRTLFLVGDPMQSIYRFRNAEVGLFLRAQQQGIGNIALTPLVLTMNFRSQSLLVDWYNQTFSAVFPKAMDIATGRVPYTKAIAAKPALEEAIHYYPCLTEAEEANLIASTIEALKNNSTTETIAILARSRAQFIPIIEALKAKNIAYQAIDIDSLYASEEIQDLLSLTRALLHRADTIAWLALLRAPFVGLTLADLAALSNACGNRTLWETILTYENITTLSNDGQHRIKNVVFYLQEAFQKQAILSLPLWIKGTWLALGGEKTSHQPENAETFFKLLHTLSEKTFTIESLIERCQKLFANDKAVSDNPIQLMTIHKSKGLEFDHVFLPGLSRGSVGDAQKLLRFCERPSRAGTNDLLIAPIRAATEASDVIYDFLKAGEKEKQDIEMGRVLYVAATRAKKTLHLSFLHSPEGSQALEGTQAPASKQQGTQAPASKQQGTQAPAREHKSTQALAREHITPKKGSFLAMLCPTLPEYLPHHPSQLLTTTPSDEKLLFKRLTVATSEHLLIEKKPFVPINIDLDDNTAQIIGTVVHEALHWIAAHQDYTLYPKKWRARLLALGVSPSKLNTALEKITTAIEKMFQDKKGRWILDNYEKAQSEWSLTTIIDDQIEKNIIDRTFIDENRVRWIIDYKTSSPSESETPEIFMEKEKEKYASQLMRYAQLFPAEKVRLGLYFPLFSGWIEW